MDVMDVSVVIISVVILFENFEKWLLPLEGVREICGDCLLGQNLICLAPKTSRPM